MPLNLSPVTLSVYVPGDSVNVELFFQSVLQFVPVIVLVVPILALLNPVISFPLRLMLLNSTICPSNPASSAEPDPLTLVLVTRPCHEAVNRVILDADDQPDGSDG